MNSQHKQQTVEQIVRSFFPGDGEGEELHVISKTTLRNLVFKAFDEGYEHAFDNLEQVEITNSGVRSFNDLRLAKVEGAMPRKGSDG